MAGSFLEVVICPTFITTWSPLAGIRSTMSKLWPRRGPSSDEATPCALPVSSIDRARRTATTRTRSRLGLDDPTVVHIPPTSEVTTRRPQPRYKPAIRVPEEKVTLCEDLIANVATTRNEALYPGLLDLDALLGRPAGSVQRQMVSFAGCVVHKFPLWRFYICHAHLERTGQLAARVEAGKKWREGAGREWADRNVGRGVLIKRPGMRGIVHDPARPRAYKGGSVVDGVWVPAVPSSPPLSSSSSSPRSSPPSTPPSSSACDPLELAPTKSEYPHPTSSEPSSIFSIHRFWSSRRDSPLLSTDTLACLLDDPIALALARDDDDGDEDEPADEAGGRTSSLAEWESWLA